MALSEKSINSMKQALERKKKHLAKFKEEFPAKVTEMEQEIAQMSKDIADNDPSPGLPLKNDAAADKAAPHHHKAA